LNKSAWQVLPMSGGLLQFLITLLQHSMIHDDLTKISLQNRWVMVAYKEFNMNMV